MSETMIDKSAVVRVAADLFVGHERGTNAEYERAIVEMTNGILGLDSDDMREATTDILWWVAAGMEAGR